MSNLTIDQTSNSNHSLGMKLTMMAVSLSDGFVTTHATNGLLHNDSALGEGSIINDIFLRSRFAFGFATRCRSQSFRVAF